MFTGNLVMAKRKQKQHLRLKTEKIRGSQERVFREHKLSNKNKKLLGGAGLFLSLNSTESIDLR